MAQATPKRIPGTVIASGISVCRRSIQVAASSSFYSPDQKDRRLRIKSEAGKITDVTYGLSLFYPWDETVNGAWNPTDVARFASPPSTDFADSLANQA